MLALWSPSSTAAHFAFCFTSVVMLAFWSHSTAARFAFCSTSCVVMLAFWSLQQLPILLSDLLVVL